MAFWVTGSYFLSSVLVFRVGIIHCPTHVINLYQAGRRHHADFMLLCSTEHHPAVKHVRRQGEPLPSSRLRADVTRLSRSSDIFSLKRQTMCATLIPD